MHPYRIFTLLLTAGLVAACNGNSASEKTSDPNLAQAPTQPTRIISLAPNLTESIFALGLGDLLIGVTPYCRFPPEAQEIPKVGALVNVNYERIQMLQPDLVVGLPSHREIASRLSVLGIESQLFRTETISEIQSNMQALGKLLGHPDKAREVVSDLKSTLDDLRTESARRRGDAARPRVLFSVGRNPGTLEQMYAAGSDNFINEILETVGAVNILTDTISPWPLVNKEKLITLDPDVIIDSSQYEDGQYDAGSHMAAWGQLPMLTAVQEGRVYRVDDKRLLVPGPGCIESAALLLDLLYPLNATQE